jgi:hypothetical protein
LTAVGNRTYWTYLDHNMPADLELRFAQQSPRTVAETTIEYVVALYRAAGASALTFGSDQLTLEPFVTRRVAVARLNVAEGLWRQSHTVLRSGRTVTGPGCLLVPLADGGRVLRGLLMLEQPQVTRWTGGERCCLLLAECIASAAAAGGEASVATANFIGLVSSKGERERAELLALLNRHEWTIARVARELKVTRRTVYLRLEKYKIPRERVRKERRREA